LVGSPGGAAVDDGFDVGAEDADWDFHGGSVGL
jgi:hypothetical protein